jgi:hypothetical protein
MAVTATVTVENGGSLGSGNDKYAYGTITCHGHLRHRRVRARPPVRQLRHELDPLPACLRLGPAARVEPGHPAAARQGVGDRGCDGGGFGDHERHRHRRCRHRRLHVLRSRPVIATVSNDRGFGADRVADRDRLPGRCRGGRWRSPRVAVPGLLLVVAIVAARCCSRECCGWPDAGRRGARQARRAAGTAGDGTSRSSPSTA